MRLRTSVCCDAICAVSGVEITTGQRESDRSGSAVICSLTSLIRRLTYGSRSLFLAELHVEYAVKDGASERGRALFRMRERRVALSGTSNTVDLLVMANARGLDHSVEPAGRTRHV